MNDTAGVAEAPAIRRPKRKHIPPLARQPTAGRYGKLHVTLCALLPIAFEEKWTARKLGEAAECDTKYAHVAMRVYAETQARSAAALVTRNTTLGELVEAVKQDALAARHRAFNAGVAALAVGETILKRFEARFTPDYKDREQFEDNDGRIQVVDHLREDAKAFDKLAGALTNCYKLFTQASGMAALEKAAIAKAGATTQQPTLNVGIESARVVLVNEPERADRAVFSPDGTPAIEAEVVAEVAPVASPLEERPLT